MKKGAYSDTFIHVSLRLPTRLRNQLNEDAKRHNITLNSLLITILAKYITFDKILEGTKALPLIESIFRELLEIASLDQMESIAKKLSSKVVRQSFAFQGVDFNIDNLIEFYFQPLSDHSGWYQFNFRIEGTSRKLMFTQITMVRSGRHS